MDLQKLLQTTEDAIYEIAVLMVFIPKAVLRAFFLPGWIQPYITDEWSKKPSERFKEFASPILCWVFVAAVPNLIYRDLIGNLFTPFPQNINAILFIVFLLGVPLLFAGALQSFSGLPLEKESLKRLFYIECLCSTPFMFGILLYEIVQPGLGFIRIDLVFGLWFFIANLFVFKQELDSGWKKALYTTSSVLILLVLFLFAAMASVATIQK